MPTLIQQIANASVDLDMKREAINKSAIDKKIQHKAIWRSDASILTWLESL